MSTSDGATSPLLAAHVVDARTVGEAWVAVAEQIAATGVAGSYDGAAMRECLMVTIRVAEPRERDAVVDRDGDPARLAWMHGNFTDTAPVPALGGADSYATRLFDYARTGRDQIAWVAERLRRDRGCRSATITTFQPLTDTTYIPCVSLLDFFVADDRLHLVVYAHSIDFGAKGYGNLVELAHLLHVVSSRTDVPVGTLQMIVKSAHVYESDDAETARILAQSEQTMPPDIG
ncbi:MAG: thymidylate synthase [Actinomycetota bacterium]|jgi:thymidylate synthase|nr:thymidylate synthase [Actinomycetota bacterium]